MADSVLSLMAAILCFIAVIFLIDQHLMKPKSYKVAWAIGLFFYGLGALAQYFGTRGHWTIADYRVWYLCGAILAAPYLGMGTIYLLAPRRIANIIMVFLGFFTAHAIIRTLTAPLSPQNFTLPAGMNLSMWFAAASNTDVVSGQHKLMPPDVVVVIAVLNSLGALALVGGAAWSAWKFYKTRTNPTRLASMGLLMIGGFAPTMAGTLAKFGVTDAFFVLTFVGALFLLAGYLVSIDVLAVLRVPFTNIVLLDRRVAPAPTIKPKPAKATT